MSSKKRLAIITSHPIQYNAPLFKLLAERNNIEIKVFYTWGKSVLQNKYDPGFGRIVEWDIPLLDGYEYELMENIAVDKGSHHFKGINNPTLNSSVEQYKADAVLVYGWSYISHLKALRYFKHKIPVLFRGDSTLLDDQPGIKKRLRYLFLNWIYRNIDYALYVGKNNFNYFKKLGVKNNQLVFAPHAIDNKRFSNNETHEQSLRSELGIGKDDFVFLFVGKLEEKKGVQVLINAFIKAGFDKNVHLVITGSGLLENKLKAEAGEKSNIHFLPFQNQEKIPVVYQVCDVFVLPSQGPGETWGLVVNEAMASGKPVIASNKCGCATDLVIPGETGFVFEAGNENELCNQLQHCKNNAIEIKRMGAMAKKKIESYSFNAVAETIERIVLKIF